MAFSPEQAYDALPALPPRPDVETVAVLKQCLKATRALAELKGTGGLIPDQSIVITREAWEPWIVYMLRGVEETAQWTTEMIRSIRALLDDTIQRAHRDAPSVGHTKELVELLFHRPYCKIAFVVQAGIAQRQTAAAYLQALEKAGILTSETVGRERIFVNAALLDLLKRESS